MHYEDTVLREGGSWSGTLQIDRGVALLDARIGDSAMHRHLAVQLSIGLDGPIEVSGEKGQHLVAAGVLIGANVHHSLGPPARQVRSLYVEPQLPLGRELAKRLGDRSIVRADAELARSVRRWETMASDLAAVTHESSRSDDRSRARRLVTLIESGDPEDGPREWAHALGISPSRLRAFCVEVFGVPPIRLRQWTRLKEAARAIAQGSSLAEAAATAGYADQAHFTRQLSRWFGVSPKRGLSALRIRVVP